MTDRSKPPALEPKLQSFGALNTLLHESRQEAASLSQRLRLKDGLVAELRARLARYEGGGEPVLFGPSESLVENLCREISKMKEKVKETEAQAEAGELEMERLRQQVKDLEQERLRLMQQPENEKELEIQRLRHALLERDRVQATRTVLYDSLAEEAEQLRSQLGATVRVCQELLRRLEAEREANGSASGTSQAVQGRKFTDCTAGAQFSPLECQLREENQVLKQRVAYVESLNAKWQKYDLSREEYVKGLCCKLKEATSRADLDLAPANVTLLQQEIGRLNHLLQQRIGDCARLNRELEELKRTDRERIQMLEQQVVTYVDDFNSERADRERAQSRIQDLQEKVAELQQRLREQDSLDLSSSWRARWDSGHAADTPPPTTPLQRNTGQQLGANRVGGVSAQGSTRGEWQSPGVLQCPRCHTTYDDDHTVEFLRHCEECARL